MPLSEELESLEWEIIMGKRASEHWEALLERIQGLPLQVDPEELS